MTRNTIVRSARTECRTPCVPFCFTLVRMRERQHSRIGKRVAGDLHGDGQARRRKAARNGDGWQSENVKWCGIADARWGVRASLGIDIVGDLRWQERHFRLDAAP